MSSQLQEKRTILVTGKKSLGAGRHGVLKRECVFNGRQTLKEVEKQT